MHWSKQVIVASRWPRNKEVRSAGGPIARRAVAGLSGLLEAHRNNRIGSFIVPGHRRYSQVPRERRVSGPQSRIEESGARESFSPAPDGSSGDLRRLRHSNPPSLRSRALTSAPGRPARIERNQTTRGALYECPPSRYPGIEYTLSSSRDKGLSDQNWVRLALL